MMRALRLAGYGLLVLVATTAVAAKESKEVKAALKQITKATKGVRGIVADVEFSQSFEKREVHGIGKLYAHFAGIVRAEIGGDLPRTILFRPPTLFIHLHDEEVVEIYDVSVNPDRLGQYVMLGFVPNGIALKPLYNVNLVQKNNELDGKPILNLLLDPRSKITKKSIARIQLWVDPETGLPAQHHIVHAVGEVQLRVRYLSMTRDDEIPDSVFLPDWPEGITTVRK